MDENPNDAGVCGNAVLNDVQDMQGKFSQSEDLSVVFATQRQLNFTDRRRFQKKSGPRSADIVNKMGIR